MLPRYISFYTAIRFDINQFRWPKTKEIPHDHFAEYYSMSKSTSIALYSKFNWKLCVWLLLLLLLFVSFFLSLFVSEWARVCVFIFECARAHWKYLSEQVSLKHIHWPLNKQHFCDSSICFSFIFCFLCVYSLFVFLCVAVKCLLHFRFFWCIKI